MPPIPAFLQISPKACETVLGDNGLLSLLPGLQEQAALALDGELGRHG